MNTRFRSNPLLHADNLLGIGTGNIIWNNYETRYYYFPVQFRPEVARPTEPKVWKQVNSFTIAFGHGVSTTPLQAAVGCAALMQGYLIPPTFLVRSEQDAMAVAKRVVSEKTVEGMRYLYTLNAEKGSARNARAPGYRVGGKTGTAEKVINGRYSKELNFNTFVAAFPMDDPQYLVFTIADAPHPEKPGMTDVAANNAGVMAGNIIRRAAAGDRPATSRPSAH